MLHTLLSKWVNTAVVSIKHDLEPVLSTVLHMLLSKWILLPVCSDVMNQTNWR